MKELCNEAGNVTYRARQTAGMVVVTANGVHNSTGYRVYFEQSMIRIFPPEFSLYHERPTGITGPAVTPFQERVTFQATEPVMAVTVHDARGTHRVRVERGR